MALTKVKASNITLTTAAAGSNDTTPATTQYVTTAINNLIDGAPATLNTLDEIAAALNDDAALNTTLTNAIAAKLPLAGGSLTGNLLMRNGGNIEVGGYNSGNDKGIILTPADSASYWHIYNDTGGELVFGRNITIGSSEHMRIDNVGKVGIGTTGPFAKSHIKDTGYDATLSPYAPYGAVQLIEGAAVTDNNWGHLVITDTATGNGNGGSIRFATGASNALNPFAGIQGDAEGTSYGGLRFYTRASGGEATERMRIRSDGTTTIGQALTPTYDNDQGYPLHIQASTGQQTYLAISVPGAASGDTGLVIGHDGTGTRITNREADPMIFGISSSEKMRIHSNGNVGINIPSSQGVSTPAINFEAWDGDGVTKMGIGNNASYVQRYQTHATAPASLVIDKARGTQASPSIVSPGDDLGRIIFRGYTNGLYEAASIQVEANTSNLVNNGADIPSDIYFKTTQDGGGGPLERLRIDYDGAVWQRHSNHGRYTWVRRVVFTGGQTQNLKFHLAAGNVHGQVRVTISGDYSNVNANGSFEKVWGWGYNSSNTSGYGGQGSGSTIVDVGYTSNVMSFGSMSKPNVSTVQIPITNTAASYSVICSIVVEITGELQGLKYTSIS